MSAENIEATKTFNAIVWLLGASCPSMHKSERHRNERKWSPRSVWHVLLTIGEAEHVPTFEAEVEEYKKHGIEFFAFWSWHDSLEL